MAQSIQSSGPLRETANDPTAAVPRLRTVTVNKFPHQCACGCGLGIPRDREIRYVVDFGTTKPCPAYLREHSPDYATLYGLRAKKEDAAPVPGFRPASELIRALL
jgi:hypothetical protein